MVAYEYAKAIHELASESNNVLIYQDYFDVLNSAINDNSEFMKLMTSFMLDKAEKKKIILNVSNNFDNNFKNFLLLLVDNERFSLLPEICDVYHQLVFESQDILFMTVISAKRLSKEQEEHLLVTLSTKFKNKKIKIKNEVDENLIGGVKILCNAESIDITVINQLNELKATLWKG